MNWIYLPFMFFLAFLYTKISFSDFQISGEKKINLTVRAPGSVSELNTNIAPYYRVPTFLVYKYLVSADLLLFNKVASYRGTIVGNADIESFGFIIDDKKKVSFTMNDFSEVTEGALFHDVIVHLISSKILDKRIAWFEYFEAYKKGIRGESFQFSFYTDRGISNAFNDSDNLFTENVTGDYPLEFTKLKVTHHHIGNVEKSLIQNELIKLFPKIQFFDLIKSKSDLTNYQILVRLRPQDKTQWLELKESSQTSYDLIFNKDNKQEFKKRFELLKMHVYSGEMNKTIFSIKMDERFFIVKFAEQFLSKIQLNQIPYDDYRDIVMDEAYVLGKIHAKSLGPKITEYIQSWATIPAVNIDEQIVGLKYGLMDMKNNK